MAALPAQAFAILIRSHDACHCQCDQPTVAWEPDAVAGLSLAETPTAPYRMQGSPGDADQLAKRRLPVLRMLTWCCEDASEWKAGFLTCMRGVAAG